MTDEPQGAEPVSDAVRDLAPVITSRFLFVDVAANRTKRPRPGALPRVERHPAGPHKLERLAMEEVRQQVIQYTVPTGFLGKGTIS
jgi:DNA-directed RNA polymerase subunit K/omega